MALLLFIIWRNGTGCSSHDFKFLLWECEMAIPSFNPLLLDYCHDLASDCSHPLSKIAVQICSIMTSGCSTVIDLPRSTGTFSAGSQRSEQYEWMKHALEFTFHCILMVLELNPLVKYLLCGPFLRHGGMLDLFLICCQFLLQLGLCSCQKNGNKITFIIHTMHTHLSYKVCFLSVAFSHGVSLNTRQQMGIMKMRSLVWKEKSNKSLVIV